MTMGEKIRQARKDVGMTQKELADALGVSESFISQYETGKREPKRQTLIKLASALKLSSPAYFFFDPVPDPEEEKSSAPVSGGEADEQEYISLYETAPAWLQEQVRSLLKAEKTNREG